jgi:MFS family permease
MSGFIGVNNQFAQKFRQPDAKLQGIITSIYDIGYAAGALLNFFFGEQFGCKNRIIAGGTTMIVGTILGSSNTLAQLLLRRIVTSIRNGFNSLTIPMYQHEMCKPSNRGILLNLQGTVTIIGLCIAYWLDFRSFLCKSTHPRAPLLFFQAFLAVCLVLQMPPLPETTRSLNEKCQNDAAAEVLARLRILHRNIL